MPTINDNRIRYANSHSVRETGQYVLYWCQMFRRLHRNHALDHAISVAADLKKPLVIYEGLKLNAPWANARFHTFLLEGMRDNAAAATKLGVSYWPFVQSTPHAPREAVFTHSATSPFSTGRGLVRKLAENACMIVTDDYPAYIVPAQIRAVASRIDVAMHAVDSNCVVPLSMLGARVGAASHIRPSIHKLFPECWPHRANAEPTVPKSSRVKLDAPFEVWTPPQDIAAFVTTLPLDQTVPALANLQGGSRFGQKQLDAFIDRKLDRYAEGRSEPDHPDDNAASGLSPWLHYGHLSIEAVIEQTLNTVQGWSLDDINRKTRNKDDYYCRDANINSFLDEAVTWRDLGYHWHFTRNLESTASDNVTWETSHEPNFNFATMDFSQRTRGTLEAVLPPWALKTLAEHAGDRREFVYSREQFEKAQTHDELWNAAQTELVQTGKIHNYLRMLWAKKVLEWTATPEEAYDILEQLNNKYAIDGRDPNSYTGILWCFGLFDRPWPGDRQVFGSVRFMSSGNTAKKFKLQSYYNYIRQLHRSGQGASGVAPSTHPPGRLF